MRAFLNMHCQEQISLDSSKSPEFSFFSTVVPVCNPGKPNYFSELAKTADVNVFKWV